MKRIKEQNFSTGREERSAILIANFKDGFTSDFRFSLPEAFRDALDIKLTPRVFFGKTEDIFTQGRNFSFDQGDVIYDSKNAYDLVWEEALKHFKISLQISKATNASTVITEVYKNVDSPVNFFINDEKDNVIEYDKISINKYVYNPGYVKFKTFIPNLAKSKVEQENVFECTQEDFVSLLQTGLLRTLNKETIKLL